MGCLNCGKDLIQIPGKRAKTFCSVTCRSNYWQKQNRGKENKSPGKPGRPKKKEVAPISNAKAEDLSSATKLYAKASGIMPPVEKPIKKSESTSPVEEFMGHPIPKGLKGIELSIWKAEIKEKNK